MNAIDVQGLTKMYGNTQALAGVQFSVAEGELFAYLGPNGSGKTTTIRILTGLMRTFGGTAMVAGYDVTLNSRKAKNQCGVVPQAVNLDRDLTVFENLMIHGRLFGLSGRSLRDRILSLLEYVELLNKKDQFVKHLSSGQQRRVMIVRALVHRPRILFLDEPTVGLDPAVRRQIWMLIKSIQRQKTTILLTTHYIEEADLLADRVALLCEGTVVDIATPDALKSRLGNWALDIYENDQMETRYFTNRRDALHTASNPQASVNIRQVNLEDAFLQMTGKKVS
jgi:ABC-2 type transport system ATP-binding protein